MKSPSVRGLVVSIICALIVATFCIVVGGPVYLMMGEVPSPFVWILMSAALVTVVFIGDYFRPFIAEGNFAEYWRSLPKMRILCGLFIYLFCFVALLILLSWGSDVYFGSGPGLFTWLALVGISIAVVTPIQLKTNGRVRSQRA